MNSDNTLALSPLPLQELCVQAHLDRLFVIASLFQAQPKPLPEARVLELGAGSGGNLLPLAALNPQTQFVAEVADEQVKARVGAWRDALELNNLEVRVSGSSADEAGTFDYILCPRAFRSLAAEQRQAMLADVKQRLAPRGMALMAYPVLPGAYFERMAGEMMAFHAAQASEAPQQAPQARAMIDFLSRAAQPEAYRTMLQAEARRVQADDRALWETVNGAGAQQALYVHDLFAMAHKAGLQYMGEAPLSAMLPENFGQSIAQTLRRMGADVLRTEQYIDFLSARRERFSIVVHGGESLDRNLAGDRVAQFDVAANVRDEGEGRFVGASGNEFAVRSPLTRQVFQHLAQVWPEAEPLAGLLRRFEVEPASEQASTLKADVLRAYMLGVVDLRAHPSPLSREAGEWPAVWRLARLQAQVSPPSQRTRICSPLHYTLEVDAFTRYLLTLLDGSRDRAALLRDLENAVATDALTMRENGQVVDDQARRRELLSKGLDQALQNLGRAGLLNPPRPKAASA